MIKSLTLISLFLLSIHSHAWEHLPTSYFAQIAEATAEAQPVTETVATVDETSDSEKIDTLFLIIAGAMVFLMQPGFLLVELGLSRSKNALNIVMKNVVDVCVAMITYLLIGFGLMFANGNGFIGMEFNWLSSTDMSSKFWAFWFFQAAFVGAVSTIASGAMAERTRFQGYIVYTLVLSAIIYPITAHWSWGGLAAGFGEGFGNSPGFLAELGFTDFAGSSVVHGVGGAAALAGIMVLGPRKGRFDEQGAPVMIVGHNLPLAALGVLLLWFGWIGFNAGSMLGISDGIGLVIVNTMAAAGAGGLFAMFTYWILHGRPDPGIVLNGILGGLVAVTACCNVISPISALFIGLVGGIISALGAELLLKYKLDDVAGAVPVHLMNGVWGTLCVALFNSNGFQVEQFMDQLIGTSVIIGSAFSLCYLTFFLVDKTIGLRATDEEQEVGLDFSEHASNAYPDFASPDFSNLDDNDGDFGFDEFDGNTTNSN